MKKRVLLFNAIVWLFCLTMNALPINVDSITTQKGWTVLDYTTKTTSNGNTYIEYKTSKDGYSQIATYFQIVDANGVKLLGDAGVKISANVPTPTYLTINNNLFVDNAGNAIIIVSDYRHSSSATALINYTAYKVSPTGQFLWGADGIDLDKGFVYSVEGVMNIIQLEDNSYVFAWVAASDNYAKIKMERVSSTGEFLFDNTVYLEEAGVSYSYPKLVNSGDNQFIMVFTKGAQGALMARKVEFDGTSVWPSDVLIYDGGFTVPSLANVFEIKSDENGGVFVGWYDDRFATNIESSYLSYIKADGSYGFTTGKDGQKLGYSGFRGFKPSILVDKSTHNVYTLWREVSSDYARLVAQKLSNAGELLWNENGAEVRVFDLTDVGAYTLRKAPTNNIAAFYFEQASTSGITSQEAFGYAKLLDRQNGNVLSQTHFTLPGDSVRKLDLQVSESTNGFWTATWKGQMINYDLIQGYLKRFTLTEATSIAAVVNTPELKIYNDGNQINIKITGSNNTKSEISIYDLAGRKVANVFKGVLEEDAQTIHWQPNLQKGTYICTVSFGNKLLSERIVVN